MVGVLLNAAVRLSFVCRSRRGPKFDTIYFEKNLKKAAASVVAATWTCHVALIRQKFQLRRVRKKSSQS